MYQITVRHTYYDNFKTLDIDLTKNTRRFRYFFRRNYTQSIRIIIVSTFDLQ